MTSLTVPLDAGVEDASWRYELSYRIGPPEEVEDEEDEGVFGLRITRDFASGVMALLTFSFTPPSLGKSDFGFGLGSCSRKERVLAFRSVMSGLEVGVWLGEAVGEPTAVRLEDTFSCETGIREDEALILPLYHWIVPLRVCARLRICSLR